MGRRSLLPSLPLSLVTVALALAPSAAVAAGGAGGASGASAHASIVGGGDAISGVWAPAAYVTALDAGDGRSLACTGSVVSPAAVLTAAHCATDPGGAPLPASAFAVVTGRRDLADVDTGQILPVARVLVHPAFDPRTAAADAALLVLARASTAPAMALAGVGDAGLAAAGTPAAVAGWGARDGAASDVPTTLLSAPMVLVADATCGELLAGFQAATMLCAGDVGAQLSSTCHGDSGGPLVVTRADGGVVQVGITSWGSQTCDPRLPQAYARVSALSDWIASASASAAAPPGASGGGLRSVAGSYRGTTGQRQPISLRVAENGSVRSLDASYRLRCGAHWRASRLRVRRPAARASSRVRFQIARTGGRGVRFRVTGAFSGGGRVDGTMRVTWRARAEVCTSGLVRYTAWRA